MLRALRDRFRGEDLADMLCLLRLHGELALRAKGVLLLRETDKEGPPLDDETRDNWRNSSSLNGRLAERACWRCDR